ncbi:S-adenosyl-L-methionine-dependent methyltransferase [Phycomyces nitens]|nr:S-adenosyl-L-methionine-dependent methyltransferase [Phycomyces nitens]
MSVGTVKAVPFHEKSYWESRFEKEDHFEWLLSWSALKPLVESYLDPNEPILHIGCGNSKLAFHLADDGYPKVINVDYAENVIQQMKADTASKYDGVEWYTGDCLNDLLFLLNKQDIQEGFSVVVDKSLCDTIACGDDDDQTSQQKLAHQVGSVVRFGGVWLCVSFSSQREHVWDQPSGTGWKWKREHAIPVAVNHPNSLPGAPEIFHYLYINRKVRA